MLKRERWALVGSILIHLVVVFFVGAGLITPARELSRVEVDLQAAQAPEKAPGSKAPVLSRAPARPETASLPSPSAVPLRMALPQAVDIPDLPTEPDGSLQPPGVPTLPGKPAVALTLPGGGSPSGTDAGRQGQDGGGGEAAMSGYFESVRRRVDAAKQYPHMAQQRRLQGRVRVSFGLTPDGRLTGEPQIVEGGSSGYGLLDRAALKAVRRGAPYPKFPGRPEDMPDPLLVEVAFLLR